MVYHKVQFSALYSFCYIPLNDLPTVTANSAQLVLYADDTSFIITNPSPMEFANKLNKVLADVNEWFRNNLLSLNLNKTTYLQFRKRIVKNLIQILHQWITKSLTAQTQNFSAYPLKRRYHGIVTSTKYLACYAIRVITPLMLEDILKMIYHLYVHSITTYGIIIWRISMHGTNNFKIQKRIIWIMTKSRSRDSCRQLFNVVLQNLGTKLLNYKAQQPKQSRGGNLKSLFVTNISISVYYIFLIYFFLLKHGWFL